MGPVKRDAVPMTSAGRMCGLDGGSMGSKGTYDEGISAFVLRVILPNSPSCPC